MLPGVSWVTCATEISNHSAVSLGPARAYLRCQRSASAKTLRGPSPSSQARASESLFSQESQKAVLRARMTRWWLGLRVSDSPGRARSPCCAAGAENPPNGLPFVPGEMAPVILELGGRPDLEARRDQWLRLVRGFSVS